MPDNETKWNKKILSTHIQRIVKRQKLYENAIGKKKIKISNDWVSK